MNRNIRKFFAFILALAIASTSLSSFAAASNIKQKSKDVPEIMQPGTILIYDNNSQPVVIEGGYATVTALPKRAHTLVLSHIPGNASASEKAQIQLENRLAKEAYDGIMDGKSVEDEKPQIYPGMKVVYDENSGVINNIYYPDASDPSGYSLHNGPALSSALTMRAAPNTKTLGTWGNSNNTLIYQIADDSFLGTGRATYFTGTIGNRNNTLKNMDMATKKSYDFSKKGDKDVSVRNLTTNSVFTFHQADVGTLPDAIIDIWGVSNLRKLYGNQNSSVTSVASVRYYHKRFSDQSVP